MSVYTRPVPSPSLSARRCPESDGAPATNPWMSAAGSPSLLVIDASANPAEPDSASVCVTDAVTGTILWFGGHSWPGLTPQVSVGGVLSTRTTSVLAAS